MTCKDCVGNEFCESYIKYDDIDLQELDLENQVELACSGFKNKADYVEVVRCVKCGFRDDNLITTSQNIDCYMCKRHHSLVLLNDFCSYGKRKDVD